MECVFCLLVEGKIPGIKIRESQNFISFVDIKANAEGQIIIIYKKHQNFVEAKDKEELIQFIDEHIQILKEAYGYKNFAIFIPIGDLGVQKDLGHLIVYIIPKKEGDSFQCIWKPIEIDEKKLKEIGERLSKVRIEKEEKKEKEELEIEFKRIP